MWNLQGICCIEGKLFTIWWNLVYMFGICCNLTEILYKWVCCVLWRVGFHKRRYITFMQVTLIFVMQTTVNSWTALLTSLHLIESELEMHNNSYNIRTSPEGGQCWVIRIFFPYQKNEVCISGHYITLLCFIHVDEVASDISTLMTAVPFSVNVQMSVLSQARIFLTIPLVSGGFIVVWPLTVYKMNHPVSSSCASVFWGFLLVWNVNLVHALS